MKHANRNAAALMAAMSVCVVVPIAQAEEEPSSTSGTERATRRQHAPANKAPAQGAGNKAKEGDEPRSTAPALEYARMLNKVLQTSPQERRQGLERLLGNMLASAAPDSAPYYAVLGSTYYYLGRYHDARTSLDRAIDLDGAYPPALYYRALVHAHSRQYKAAVNDLLQAIRYRPHEVRYWSELGRVRLALKNVAQARIALKQAARLAPADANVWLWLGHAEAMAGKDEAAASYYDKAVHLDGQLLEAHEALAYMAHKRGAYKKAILHYEKMVEYDPARWRNMALLVQLYTVIGDHEKAAKAREALIALRRRGDIADLNATRFFIREQMKIKAGVVTIFEFFSDKDERSKRYVLVLSDKTGTHIIKRVVLSEMAGSLPYRIDLFIEAGRSHMMHKQYKTIPAYDEFRLIAMGLITASDKGKQ